MLKRLVRKAGKLLKTIVPKLNLVLIMLAIPSAQVLAASTITEKFKTLYGLVSTLVTGVGSVMLLWFVFEFGVSMSSGEPGGQGRALKGIAGGIFMLIAASVAQALGAVN